MPDATPGPHPSDPDAIGDAVDDLEERVIGHRVDPPHSSDIAEEDGGEVPDGSGRGTSGEPS